MGESKTGPVEGLGNGREISGPGTYKRGEEIRKKKPPWEGGGRLSKDQSVGSFYGTGGGSKKSDEWKPCCMGEKGWGQELGEKTIFVGRLEKKGALRRTPMGLAIKLTLHEKKGKDPTSGGP